MKLTIANENCAETLGSELRAAAQGRPDRLAAGRHLPELTALRLADAQSEAEFLHLFVDHLRKQHGRFAEGYALVGRPGLVGRLRTAVHRGLARVMKPHHDRQRARQGLLNELLLAALEFQGDRSRRALDELRKRVDVLEAASRPGSDSESVP